MHISSAHLIWLLIFFLSLKPVFDHYMLSSYRVKLLKAFESKRGSRIIALVHRQEAVSLFGMPVIQYINIEDAQSVLNAIRLTDDDVPIDILLHTPSDLSLPAEQIARALMRHKAKVTVIVPHYAMSGGTAIALAADQLIMSENAVLGAIEPVINGYPASSYLHVLASKSIAKIADETWIYADLAGKQMAQAKSFVLELLKSKESSNLKEEADLNQLAHDLTAGRWTHDYPISVNELRDLALEISTDVPLEIYQLMNLYPQAKGARPSVEFIALPYLSARPLRL